MKSGKSLSAGDGGHDTNFITLLALGSLSIEEANVLLIEKHIDERR
jgi:hypothetical protein